MERITIYPNKELKDWLERISQEEQRSLNQQIIFILKKYKGGIKENATRPTGRG